MTTCKKSEQIILQHVSCQRNAWLSTWFANVVHMKGELWCISAPAAVKSLTAPDQASPWPSLKEGPPTGHYGAHTESRTTSALRRNNARPAEKSGRGSEWTRAVIAHVMIRALAMEKNRIEKQRKWILENTRNEKRGTTRIKRHRPVCQHQDVSVVTPPVLCTWISYPTGILNCF